ncbi:DUF4402 domain-containing protein [Sphingopyxis sp. FD7]|uniref:DUF4402 domain-containing protein n=1 Tax=Sphingopyxis sp. FD7 TaxID=1914525 RepID=UPI000DC62778|nr:DUF4402 domain-containing protein [Sphingopyxis sp. FD7]BBB13929.1 type II transmembrane serine protease-1 [Sphingopyxis sp. FD7]
MGRLSFLLIASLLPMLPKAVNAQLAVTQVNLDMPTIEAPAAASGTVGIGTNGSMSYPGGYSGGPSGTPGQVLINGTVGRRTLISCQRDKTARNVGGAGGNLDIENFQIFVVLGSANTGGPGVGATCNGIDNNVIDVSLPAAASARTIYIGANLAANNVRAGGNYRLSNHPNGRFQIKVRQQGGGPPVEITVTVDFSSNFIRPLTLTPLADLDFADIEVGGTVGAGDQASIGTNGSITYAGDFAGSGSGTAGAVRLSGGVNGTTYEIYCDATAQLRNLAGTSFITMNSIQVAPETSRGAFGTGALCNGITGAAATTFVFQNTTRDDLYFGGRLDGATANGTISGLFSTSHPSGNSLDILVVGQ